MSSNLDNIWTEVLNLIKVELTQVSFNTWLKTVEPVNISDTKVILAAPNEFTKKRSNAAAIRGRFGITP